MIAELNRLVELVEDRLTGDLDVSAVATELATTEYHLRRMFSSLAGIPLSEYIRPEPGEGSEHMTSSRWSLSVVSLGGLT